MRCLRKPKEPKRDGATNTMTKSNLCLCLLNPDQYTCNPDAWKKILGSPWMKHLFLKGNDNANKIQTCAILLSGLGPRIQSRIDSDVVQLNHPFDVVKELHNFAVSGTCSINDVSVLPILKAAKEFGLERIQQLAGQFMISTLNCGNVHDALVISQTYLCKHFRQRVVAFILSNFWALTRSDDFLIRCTPDIFRDILRSDRLDIHEDDLFLVLLKWSRLADSHREKLTDMLRLLRFNTMRSAFLETLCKPGFLQSPGRDLSDVEETFIHTLVQRQLRSRAPKKFRVPSEVIMSFGGFKLVPLNTVESFDARTEVWSCVDHLQTIPPHAYHGLAYHDSKVYVVGGYGKDSYFRSLYSLDLETLKWSKKSSMVYKRCYVSVAVLDGKIYCMGGYNSQFRTSVVECYDPKLNQWDVCNPMNVARSDACALTINGKIMIVGGFNGVDVQASTELFDPVKNTWSFGPRMTTPRSGLRAVSIGNSVYAIGGFDGSTRLDTVECLNFADPAMKWTIHNGKLLSKRSNFGAAVLQNKIIIAGGFNGSEVIPGVEMFSPDDAGPITSTALPPLTQEKSALSLVTLPGLPDSLKFLKRP